MTEPTPRAEIYSRNNCPYCVRAERLLKEKGIDFAKYEAGEVREQLIERVTQATISPENPKGKPPQTVPQIFLDGQYIGGFTELDAHFKAQDAAQSS